MKLVLLVLTDELGDESMDIASVLMVSVVLLAVLQPFTGAVADKYGYARMIRLGGLLGAASSLLRTTALSWKQLFG